MVKRIYNFEKIRGVDVSSSPISVASNRASYMINMINEDGTNKKRHGWRDIAWFEDSQGDKLPINGIFEWQDGYVVHAGTHFYECGKDFSVSKELELAEGVTVTSTKIKGYVQDGKLWIVGAGEYLVYDSEIIQPVLESKYAYIPTTSIGITASIEGDKINSKQGVNLFTKRRKNKLVGVTNKTLGAHTDGIYKLDGLIDTEKPFELTLEAALEDFEASYPDENGQDVTNRLNGNLVIVFKDKSYTISGDVYYKDSGGKRVAVENFNEYYEFKNYCFDYYNKEGCGYVKFGHMLSTPVIEGDSNITVEYAADYESDIMISQSSEVTLSAGVNVLCLTNNSNMLYFSDFLYGYGYFPDNDFVGLGKETEGVTAILPLDDGSIGIFKKNEYYKIALGIRTIDEEFVVRLEPSVVAYYPGIGCENQFVGANVNGDSLIFSASGVHGILSSASKPVNMRSTNVNRELCAYSERERESAFAVSHEGRYYLFIDGKVYIADTRFKTYESNRLDSGFEYEWWIWDSSDARCAYSFDGELLLGLEDGTVRQLGQGWRDERRINVSCTMGEMLYDGQSFTFNEELGVADGDRVQILNTYEKLNNSRLVLFVGADTVGCSYTEAVDFETNGSAILPFDSVILHNAENGIEIPCEVVELQPDSLGVVLMPRTKQVINQALDWNLVREPMSYTASTSGNSAVNLLDSDGRVAMFVANGEMAAVIEKSTPVACELRTGAIDFYKLHSKSLYKLSITPSEDTVGEIEIGYETNLGKSSKARHVGNGFDFKSFDFKSFVFDGNFSKTFVKRVFERNFNYIIFKFASKGDGPFGIENAQAVYSVNNELRGDL